MRLVALFTLTVLLDPGVAVDLLWTITSVRMWEDLVVQRGWSAEKFQDHVNRLLWESITNVPRESQA